MSDPIANLITSINNAKSNSLKKTCVPASKYKENILYILKNQKAIDDYKRIKSGNFEVIEIDLNNNFKHLKRVSKSGRRLYLRSNKIFRYRDGFSIISTPEGVMTEKEAYKKGIGGEIIMEVV